jgi:hypothetical protein
MLAKATLAGGSATAKVLTLADTDALTLADTGTIVAAGENGKVALPNTEFGAGTYTADGAVAITPGTEGDTIETANEAGKGLTFSVAEGDTIALTATGAAAEYTFAASGDSDMITFGKVSNVAAITIPGGSTAANFTVPVAGTVVIGQGTNGGVIVFGCHATASGTLTTGDGSVIEGILIVNANGGNGTNIVIASVGVTAVTAADAEAAGSDGFLTTTTGGTFTVSGVEVSVTINNRFQLTMCNRRTRSRWQTRESGVGSGVCTKANPMPSARRGGIFLSRFSFLEVAEMRGNAGGKKVAQG